jgi:hypothetical protein
VVKHKELTVQVMATVKVGYNVDELEAMGKTFREFKLGVEQVIKADLLPAFQADPHTNVEVLTVGFPSKRNLTKSAKSQVKLKG